MELLIREYNKKCSKLGNSKAVFEHLKEFGNQDREHFIVLGLDTKNKIIYREIVAIGTLNSCIIHPREVFKKAIVNSANSIIIAHNHPSQDLEPSNADIEIYERLKKVGKLLDIQVIDAVVFSKENYYSFNENE